MKPIVLAVSTEADIETAFATLVQQGADALLVTQNPFLTSKREQFFVLAARHALPMMYNERESAEAGASVMARLLLRDFAKVAYTLAKFSRAPNLRTCP